MKWTLTTDGRFDVSSYYEALRGAREVLIPWNVVFQKGSFLCVDSSLGKDSNR
jgi:hypothetical protein